MDKKNTSGTTWEEFKKRHPLPPKEQAAHDRNVARTIAKIEKRAERQNAGKQRAEEPQLATPQPAIS